MLWKVDETREPLACLTCEPLPTWELPGKAVAHPDGSWSPVELLGEGWDRRAPAWRAPAEWIAWDPAARVWRHPDGRWSDDTALIFVCPD